MPGALGGGNPSLYPDSIALDTVMECSLPAQHVSPWAQAHVANERSLAVWLIQ